MADQRNPHLRQAEPIEPGEAAYQDTADELSDEMECDLPLLTRHQGEATPISSVRTREVVLNLEMSVRRRVRSKICSFLYVVIHGLDEYLAE